MNAPPAAPTKNPNTKWWVIAGGCGCFLILIPIVAAIAIPAFITYVKRSKTTEATSELRSLATTIQSRCQSGEDLSGLQAGPLPAVPGSIQSMPVWQSDPGFARLGWQASAPVRYSYYVKPVPDAPSQLYLEANGDLDDDGVLSTYGLTCDLSECFCTSDFFVEDGLE